MSAMEPIQTFLRLRRFAFVGVSQQPRDFSRSLFREFLARGYQAIPVHPAAAEIEGQTCFAHVGEIKPAVDAALIMTSPQVTGTVVRECAQAGIKQVWLFRGGGQGAVTPEDVQFCQANGISVIPGECPFMYLPNSQFIHRLHGFVRRITGSYPR